jgi:hypothetical protein
MPTPLAGLHALFDDGTVQPLSRTFAKELLEAFPRAEITTTFTSAESVPAAIVGSYDLDEPLPWASRPAAAR